MVLSFQRRYVMKKEQEKFPQEHHNSHIEVISSIAFVVLVVIGMYFLSVYLNN